MRNVPLLTTSSWIHFGVVHLSDILVVHVYLYGRLLMFIEIWIFLLTLLQETKLSVCWNIIVWKFFILRPKKTNFLSVTNQLSRFLQKISSSIVIPRPATDIAIGSVRLHDRAWIPCPELVLHSFPVIHWEQQTKNILSNDSFDVFQVNLIVLQYIQLTIFL